MYKYIILAILAFNFIYDVVTSILSRSRKDMPLPENVRDVFDAEQYRKWRAYSADVSRIGMFEGIFNFVLLFVLFATNVFSLVYNVMPGSELVKSLLLMILFSLGRIVLFIPFDYYRVFKIEEKYGFNRTSKKTF